MTIIIEIEGGLVNVVERVVTASIPIGEWLPHIEKRNPIHVPTLPPGTRAMSWDPRDPNDQILSVLIELQPSIIQMDYQGDIRTLSVPYTRFFFEARTSNAQDNMLWSLTNYRIFWAKTEYEDPDKKDMIAALLPNVYEDGRICFGSTGADVNQTLAKRLSQTVNEFYASQFNNDLAIRRPQGARGWRQWERMTQNDPTGWMEWSDLDPSQGIHMMRSYNNLIQQTATQGIGRFEPMVAANPIPEVPIGASFGRVQQWIDETSVTFTAGPERILQALLADRRMNPERYAIPVDEEDDDDDA